MPRRERILLLRSGRHLRVATDALAQEWPGAEIAVVGTPGSERAIEQAGISCERTFLFTGVRFTPVNFLLSRTAVRALWWRPTQVAVLWNDPDGSGQGNVDRTAFALAPRGFLAITPDGRVIPRSIWPQVGHEARRAAASVATAVLLCALYVPALLASVRRR